MAEDKKTELSEQEIVEAAQKINKDKEEKFIQEYNELCSKHGLQISPQMTLVVTRSK